MKKDQFLSFPDHQAVMMSPVKILFVLARWMWAKRKHRPFEFAVQSADSSIDFDCVTVANQYRGIPETKYPQNEVKLDFEPEEMPQGDEPHAVCLCVEPQYVDGKRTCVGCGNFHRHQLAKA